MSGPFAKAGEHVTDAAGNVICTVMRDLHSGEASSVTDFGEFTEGNTPWVAGQPMDARCCRGGPLGPQIRIEGEWRP